MRTLVLLTVTQSELVLDVDLVRMLDKLMVNWKEQELGSMFRISF